MITILTLATTVASLYILSLVLSLHRNYAVARASGLRCIIVPFHLANVSWVIIQPLILPLLDRLPTRWTSPWLPFLSMDRCWSYGHAAFAGTCTDTVIAVSAWGNILHTCDAGASAQLFQGSTFEKPAKLLALLNIYGPTMTGTEHHETRLYRKVAAPFFNEKTMRKTWDATVQDAQALGKVLSGNAGGPTQRQLRPTLAKLTLHVVNKVCFEADRDIVEELEFRPKAEQGHRLSYSNAMHTVMENLRELFAIPKPILNFGFKTARQAQMELDQYLEELIERKNDQLTNDNQVTDQGLLKLLVTAGRSPNPTIQSSAVKGNIFLFMFAGHEANANTMTFLVHLLAMHPSLQRSFQSDIDAIPTPFSYPSSYNTAMSSLPGAVINEALRLYTVIPFILKSTWSTPQPITFGKETHNIPPDTLILMHTNATHRNPKYWPEPEKEKLGTGGMPYPVAAFNPYHWIGNKDESNEDGWRRFLTPKPGTYFPFSEGLRGCLGKKFALVELCAVVCQLFSEYSVELAVDGVNDCESATEMSKEERIERWNRAHQKAEYEMSAGVEFNMSLRMTGEVPVRFVRRGMEIFGDVNESE